MSEDRYIPTDELHHDSYTYRGKLITDLQRQLTLRTAERDEALRRIDAYEWYAVFVEGFDPDMHEKASAWAEKRVAEANHIDDAAEMVRAPFTPAQVANMNRYQQEGFGHAFTCGNGGHSHGVLIATKDGWICPRCDYTQDWTHKRMADGKFVNQEDARLGLANPDHLRAAIDTAMEKMVETGVCDEIDEQAAALDAKIRRLQDPNHIDASKMAEKEGTD